MEEEKAVKVVGVCIEDTMATMLNDDDTEINISVAILKKLFPGVENVNIFFSYANQCYP